jgi:hypothetical protein
MTAKAKESTQIQKARNKIKQQLQKAEKKMNPEALHAMSLLIREQLNRKKSGRIDLKNRQIISFDENKHPAQTESKFVIKLIRQIKQQQNKSDLEGRIKPLSKAKH